MIKGGFDMSGVLQGLDRLGGPGKESLARRMGVSAGRVLRDEAERQAPQGKTEWQAQAQFGGSKNAGLLKDSMYVAFNAKATTDTVFVYSVSWNRVNAPHGHLIEFGHWRPYAVIYSPKFGWRTDKSRKLPGNGKWVPAHPFLSVAYHVAKDQAFAAAADTGRREFPKLLSGEAQ